MAEGQFQRPTVDVGLEEVLAIQGRLGQTANELLHGDFAILHLRFQVRYPRE
jgi:hypothetical protein